MDWQVFTADSGRNITGTIDVWSALDVTLRHNRGGVWTLTMPGGHPQAALLAAGSRIILRRGDTTVMSGPVRNVKSTLPEGSVQPVAEFSGTDDTARLGHRIVFPDPGNSIGAQGAAYDTRTGVAETIIRALIDDNAGPGAHTGRPIPGLALTTDAALGSAVSMSARFDNLLDVCGDLAAAGGVGYRIVQDATGGGLGVHFSAPVDRSGSIRFGPDLGNLRAWSYSMAAPAATWAAIGGQGEGVARTLLSRDAPEGTWGEHVERFVDARDSDDTATLNQRGDEYLADNSGAGGLTLTPIDTPNRSFGVDYWLGDTVTVDMGGDATFTDSITEVRMVANASGQTIKPTIGAPASSGAVPGIYQRVTDINKRLAQLERRR